MSGQADEWFDTYMAGVDQRRQLSFPFCEQCGKFHWYPKAACPHCRRPGWLWKAVSGDARLFTWTAVRHSFASEFTVPFTVLIVELVESPDIRVVSNLDPDARETRLSAGMRMRATFGKRVARTDASMPTFAPIPGSAEAFA